MVRMIRDQGLSVSQVCKDLDLVDSAVRRWIEQYDAETAGGPGKGRPLTSSDLLKLQTFQLPYQRVRKYLTTTVPPLPQAGEGRSESRRA